MARPLADQSTLSLKCQCGREPFNRLLQNPASDPSRECHSAHHFLPSQLTPGPEMHSSSPFSPHPPTYTSPPRTLLNPSSSPVSNSPLTPSLTNLTPALSTPSPSLFLLSLRLSNTACAFCASVLFPCATWYALATFARSVPGMVDRLRVSERGLVGEARGVTCRFCESWMGEGAGESVSRAGDLWLEGRAGWDVKGKGEEGGGTGSMRRRPIAQFPCIAI